MGYSSYDPVPQNRRAWNTGKIVGTKRPINQLFDLAIDSDLRGCGRVKLKIGEVVAGCEIRTQAIVI